MLYSLKSIAVAFRELQRPLSLDLPNQSHKDTDAHNTTGIGETEKYINSIRE